MKSIALILFTAATMAGVSLSSDEACCPIQECQVECCEEKKACDPACCVIDAATIKDCKQATTETVAVTVTPKCNQQLD